ncbi:MAG: hypothetical protein ABH840_04745 [Nanoarchaeota archaeon]
MKLKKKSQSAIEFVVLFSALLFFFSVFFLVIQEKNAEKIEEQQNELLKITAYSVQGEIALAFKSSEGYSREFTVPAKMGNSDYSIQITERMVYVNDSKNAIALPVHEVDGNLVKGANLIKKENGRVVLN